MKIPNVLPTAVVWRFAMSLINRFQLTRRRTRRPSLPRLLLLVLLAAPIGLPAAPVTGTIPEVSREIPRLRVATEALGKATISLTNEATDLSGLDTRRLQVFTRHDGVWKQLEAAVSISQNQIVAPIVPDQLSLVVTPATNRQMLSRTPIRFPFLKNDFPTKQLRPEDIELYAEPSPARWNSEQGEFETEVHVTILRKGERLPSALRPPVHVTLRGEGASAEPRELSFDKTLQAATARVRFPRNDVDARIDARPFTQNAPLILPVRRLAQLRASASPQTILGYGLGTSRLTVTRLDADGAALDEGPALPLQIASNAARLGEPTAIPAGKSGVTIQVRSSGVGTDAITVHAGARGAAATIHYKSPWIFLAFAIAGSVFGGSARFISKGARRADRPWTMILEGCIAGVLATAAVCAGVAWSILPGAVHETELFAFLTSAAVAMLGVAGISWFRHLAPRPGPA